jgi:hypothetical protein
MDTRFVICYELICPFFEAISAHPSLTRGYRQPRVPNATESWLSNNQPRRLVRPRNSDIRRVRLVIVITIIIIQNSANANTAPIRALLCNCAQAEEASGSFRFVKKKKKLSAETIIQELNFIRVQAVGTTVSWFQLRCVGTPVQVQSRGSLQPFSPVLGCGKGLPLSCHGISARSAIPSACLQPSQCLRPYAARLLLCAPPCPCPCPCPVPRAHVPSLSVAQPFCQKLTSWKSDSYHSAFPSFPFSHFLLFAGTVPWLDRNRAHRYREVSSGWWLV